MSVDPRRMNALSALFANDELGLEEGGDVPPALVQAMGQGEEPPMENPQLPGQGQPQQQGPPPAPDETVGGLNPEFANRFKALQEAVARAGGELMIYSGSRTPEHQDKLYKNAIQKFGDEKTAKKWVSPPGQSNHDPAAGRKLGLGDGALGADVRGDLALAHKLAPKFGLSFPEKNQAWHIELAGIRTMTK